MPRCYFSFEDMLASNDLGYFPYTPSVPMLHGLRAALNLLFDEGLPRSTRNVEAIARDEAPKLGLDFNRAKTYIGKIVKYDLGREELGGLDLFRRYLVRQRLVPTGQGFDFYTR